MIEDILAKVKARGILPTEQKKTPPADGIYCEHCNNSGYVEVPADVPIVTPCPKCFKKRQSYKILKRSVGCIERYMSYTLDNFKTDTHEHLEMKRVATKYIADYTGRQSFGVFGRSGTGKTHICIAICHELVKKGKSFCYVEYRAEMDRLKNQQGNYDEREGYERRMKELKQAENLYIDDMFKLFSGSGYSDRKEIQIMYDLINARYMSNKATLFSSEHALNEILQIDEAIGSRIFEMCNGYLVKAGGKNERIKLS